MIDPTKVIPFNVWEQISVVVIFALLLAGMGYILVKIFVRAIADINNHYSVLLINTNAQWQKYFDAKIESSVYLSEKLTSRMDEIAKLLAGLAEDFSAHDQMERQALDGMNGASLFRKK